MNFELSHIPERTQLPRQHGLTMVMDKGLSQQEVHNMLDIGRPHIDFVKLGFGTAYVTPNFRQKLEIYAQQDIKLYLGGTLFEAFIARDSFSQYTQMLKEYNIKWVEVSDGSISIKHSIKCDYISRLADEGFSVLSEVGSKDANHVMAPFRWVEQMGKELKAGSSYVIAEAREAGNIGIYRGSGEVREGLVEEILHNIDGDRIIWEAPQKAQQLYFLQLLGCNVNLGNIAPNEILALEAMRVGLRGDTFDLYMGQKGK